MCITYRHVSISLVQSIKMSKPIFYQVNLEVDPQIESDFSTWLQKHIHEILSIDGFINATWYKQLSSDDNAMLKWSVQYQLKDQNSLNNYLKNHAPKLRQDGIKLFSNQFKASRTISYIHQVFDA